jgi:hypothetical protein
MRRKANDCPEGQHGPVYNVMGAGLELSKWYHWFIVPGIILGFYWGVSSLLNAGNDDGLGTMLGWLLGQVFFMIDTTLRMLFGGG